MESWAPLGSRPKCHIFNSQKRVYVWRGCVYICLLPNEMPWQFVLLVYDMSKNKFILTQFIFGWKCVFYSETFYYKCINSFHRKYSLSDRTKYTTKLETFHAYFGDYKCIQTITFCRRVASPILLSIMKYYWNFWSYNAEQHVFIKCSYVNIEML